MGSARYLGRFAVRAELGSGPLGSVFLAYDPQLERDVAIRVIDDSLAPAARAMAQLSHPNLVHVFEVGHDHHDTTFIVMEHVAGARDLGRWLAETPRTPAAVLAMFAQIGRGLAAAHERRIMHGDLRPAKVLIGDDERPRLVDVGLSQEPASVSADVRAFCAALDASLDPSTLPHELRIVLGRGNPELAHILAALAPRRSRTPWLLAGAATLALGGAAAAMLVVENEPPPVPCDEPAAWLTPVERGRIQHIAATRKNAEGIAKQFDDVDAGLKKQFGALCTARREHKITEEQAAIRLSCLQRRVFEIDVMVDGVLENQPGSVRRATFTDRGEPCVEIVAPPITDPVKVAALWGRYARIDELAGPTHIKEHEQYVRALERDAVAANETELAMRVALALSRNLEFQDKLAESDAAAERAAKTAHELRSLRSAAFAQLQRASIALRKKDAAAALTFAQSAEEMSATRKQSPLFQTQVAHARTRAAMLKADYKGAAEYARTGIDIAVANPTPAVELEMDMRIQLVNALLNIDGRAKDALAEGEVLAARSKLLQGEHDNNYAVALDTLATAKRVNGDRDGALALTKQALDISIEVLPAGHSSVLFQHADYGQALLNAGRAREAREHFAIAVAGIDENQTVRASRTTLRLQLAMAMFEVGEHEDALALAQIALENAIQDQGLGHIRTISAHFLVLGMALELDHLDEAAQAIAATSRLRKQPGAKSDSTARGVVGLRAFEAELAGRRGKPRECERIAREVIATMTELKAPKGATRQAHFVLGECLLDQRRYSDARSEFRIVLELGRDTNVREDQLALAEVALARVELAEGKRAKARERAQRAKAILVKYPAQPRGLRQAAEILGEKPGRVSASSSSVRRDARSRRP